MPKTIVIDDIKLVGFHFALDDSGNLGIDVDYRYVDDVGDVIDGWQQQKSPESRPLSEYPQEIQDIVIALNAYAKPRIKSAEGI